MPETAAEIWADDLFDRRAEAELLVGYIESVYSRQFLNTPARGYTIAVDAGYGEGKTYFLQRLARHLRQNHPVAFIDAWADDLANEPMTAISATLGAALGTLGNHEKLQGRWNSFLQKSGKVVRIAAKGLATRAAGVLITATAAEAVAGLIEETSEVTKDAAKDALKEGGAELAKATIDEALSHEARDLMAKRIHDFKLGQNAIAEMKASLREIVEALDRNTSHPPIVIIVDELDRCRPTYAIKLLEEVKHLFDVPGLVFIFGLHGDQLSHSIRGAYGPTFDGKSYLRRFINRKFSLRSPNLSPLLKVLLEQARLSEADFAFPTTIGKGGRNAISISEIIASYMTSGNLRARDAFEVVDILQTCRIVSNLRQLELAYLLPLIMGHILGEAPGTIPPMSEMTNWMFEFQLQNGSRTQVNPQEMAELFRRFSLLEHDRLRKVINSDDYGYAEFAVFESRSAPNSQILLGRIENYPKLIQTVARFRDISQGN